MGTRRYCFRSDDQVLSVAAVEIDPGDLALHAHREIAAPAWVANKTMTAMPADSDSLTLRPWHDIASDRVDATGNFMTRHTWILNARPETVLHQDIAVANATRLHFHANLPRAWLRNFALHQFPIPAGFADLRRLHFHNLFFPSRLLSWTAESSATGKRTNYFPLPQNEHRLILSNEVLTVRAAHSRLR